jgi:hypothetical protein
MTYPLIGNYGNKAKTLNRHGHGSKVRRPRVQPVASNWRSEETLVNT